MPDEGNDAFFEYLIGDFGNKEDKSNDPASQDGSQDEKQTIISFMEMYEGNISMVSRKMGVSRNTMYKKLKKYNIKY